MPYKNIRRPAKRGKVAFRTHFILAILIALLSLLISGCNTLPSAAGSADARFFGGSFSGLSGADHISAMEVDPRTGNVFVAGRFRAVGDVLTEGIVIYNPTENRWSAIANSGLAHASGQGHVSALAFSGRYLFAGGGFTRTADGVTTGLGNIARYDLEFGNWSALTDGGLDANVNSLAVIGTDLYVGGNFSYTNGPSPPQSNKVIRYNIVTNTWSPLPNGGLDSIVDTLAVFAGDLIVGGRFTGTLHPSPLMLGHIARYDTDTDAWVAPPDGGLNGVVTTLAVSSLGVFAGGQFGQTADGAVNLNKLAFWGSNTWSPVSENGLDLAPYAMAVAGNDLYVGGDFSATGDGTELNRIGRLTNNTWHPLVGNGLDDAVSALTTLNGVLYGSGRFTQTYDLSVQDLKGFARYGVGAAPLADERGSGLTGWTPSATSGIGLNGVVNAIESGPGGVLYVGGLFSKAYDGTEGLNKIARFDPATSTWSALAASGLNGTVNALAVSGNSLYVGGSFTFSFQGGVALSKIARYDISTNTWYAMPGNGLNNTVHAMTIVGNYLYVGGYFTDTSDLSVTNLNLMARFDLTTNTWSPVGGNGLSSGVVLALASYGNEVIVGGYFFATADGSVSNLHQIARYNTVTGIWSTVANDGLDQLVRVIAIDGDRMMLRGDFHNTYDYNINGLNRLANYDLSTNQWSTVSGNTPTRDTLLKTNASRRVGNDMYIGGSFTSVGGRVALYFTRVFLNQWVGPAPRAMMADWFSGSNWTTGSPPAANTNAVIPSGSGPIDIASADVTLGDLMLNGGTLNIGLGRTLTINGRLNLNGGNINGPGSVVVTSCNPDAVTVLNPTSYIESALTRCVNGVGAYNFYVGTANGYSPVTIKNITGTGNISVKSNQGTYTNPATGLPTNRLARWWQIENPGGGVTSSDIYFNYLQTDLAGNEYGYRAYRISGGTASVISGNVNSFSNIVYATNVTAFSDWTLAEFAPTAANVSVGGRVLTADGNGINKASVTLTDQGSVVRRAITNSFGYYRFDEVEAGQTYVLSVGSKRYVFANPSLVLSPTDDALDIDFVAMPSPNAIPTRERNRTDLRLGK